MLPLTFDICARYIAGVILTPAVLLLAILWLLAVLAVVAAIAAAALVFIAALPLSAIAALFFLFVCLFGDFLLLFGLVRRYQHLLFCLF